MNNLLIAIDGIVKPVTPTSIPQFEFEYGRGRIFDTHIDGCTLDVIVDEMRLAECTMGTSTRQSFTIYLTVLCAGTFVLASVAHGWPLLSSLTSAHSSEQKQQTSRVELESSVMEDPDWGSLFENFGSLFVSFGTRLYGGKCGENPDGCLLGTLAYNMYLGVPGTDNCTQICTLYPAIQLSYSCGVCVESSNSTLAPSQAPSLRGNVTTVPSAAPWANKTGAPSGVPTTGNSSTVAPSLVPTSGNSSTLAPSSTPVPFNGTDAPSRAPSSGNVSSFGPSSTPVPTATLTPSKTLVPTTTLVPSGANASLLPTSTVAPTTTLVPDTNATLPPSGTLSPTSTPAPNSTLRSPTKAPKASKAPTKAPKATKAPTKASTAARPTTKAPSLFDSTYNIDLQFVNISVADQKLFFDAANVWSSVIVGDLVSRRLQDAPLPPIQGCPYPDEIDDVFICGFAEQIDQDGTLSGGNVLASAGPTWLRGDNLLPVAGFIRLDEFDLPFLREFGNLDDILRHEMAHVLAYGTGWADLKLVSTDSSVCSYRGERANSEYKLISGCDTVPLELEGGGGSACSHWSENCLQAELMTPTLNNGVDNTLSRITIAAFEDIGYNVSYAAAGPFGRSDLGAGCACSRRLSTDTPGLQRRGNRRLLSDKSHQMAIAYGKSVLAQNRLPEKADFVGRDLLYVGDKVVSVLLMEGNQLFSVVVTPSS